MEICIISSKKWSQNLFTLYIRRYDKIEAYWPVSLYTESRALDILSTYEEF